jgi:hypothetical protein
MLSGIGVAAVPTDVLERATLGKELSNEEAAMLARHPDVTARLLGRIPRLEGVSGIIRAQAGAQEPPAKLEQHVQILHLAVTVADELIQERSLAEITSHVEALGTFDRELIVALRTLPIGGPARVENKNLRQLMVGMTLRQDVFTRSDVMLASAGMVLSESLLERIRNFALSAGVDEPITVSVGQPIG